MLVLVEVLVDVLPLFASCVTLLVDTVATVVVDDVELLLPAVVVPFVPVVDVVPFVLAVDVVPFVPAVDVVLFVDGSVVLLLDVVLMLATVATLFITAATLVVAGDTDDDEP